MAVASTDPEGEARHPQHRSAAVGRSANSRFLTADTLVAVDGIITAVGQTAGLRYATQRIESSTRRGQPSSPGLIDSHVHPVFGDWTPRQSQIGWIDSFLHGGITTMISAGEVHLPGRPTDVVGLKSLAITAQRAFSAFRPGGVKVIAGAPVVGKGDDGRGFS